VTGTRIRLTGHIDVPADRRDAIAAALPEHIRLSRAEPGCLSFEVTPDPAVPGRLAVAELFESRAAFEAHQGRVAASDWGRISDGIARTYEISETGS
jgi:quinol monooxygenase YgiN